MKYIKKIETYTHDCFYQDIFDGDEWEEVFIESEDDIKDLEERIELYKSSSKFNI